MEEKQIENLENDNTVKTEEIKEENMKRKGMTLPNKLTLMRILLIPIMFIIYYIPYLNEHFIFRHVTYSFFICFWIFTIASFTDFFDGKIARKYNLVTTFGKFADPLADKMLVFSAMTILMTTQVKVFGISDHRLVPVWVFSIMLIRELMVSGIRMLSAGKGEVIAAKMLGKIKTFVTMIAIGVLFFYGLHDVFLYIGIILMYVSCFFTILSGAEYFMKSRHLIFESI